MLTSPPPASSNFEIKILGAHENAFGIVNYAWSKKKSNQSDFFSLSYASLVIPTTTLLWSALTPPPNTQSGYPDNFLSLPFPIIQK